MRLKYFVPFVVAVAANINAVSQSYFDKIIDEILLNDPSFKAVKIEHAASLAVEKSENLLPGPEVEGEYLWASSPAEKNRIGFSVSQSFEWPTVYSARRKALSVKSEANDLLLRSELSDGRLAVRQLLIDIVFVRRRMALAASMCNTFDSLLVKYKSGFDRGEYSRFDYSKIKIERVRSQRNLSDYSLQYNQLMSSLTIRNGGLTVDNIVGELDEFPLETMYSLSEYEQAYGMANPALRLATANLNVAKNLLDVDKKKLLPDISVGYRFAREDGNNFHGLVVGFNLPFIYGTKAKTKSTSLSVEAAETRMDALAVQLRADLMSDYTYVSSLRDKLSELTSAADIIDCRQMLQKALYGGEISLVQYLLELNYYTELELEILDFEYRYHLALARLNRYM
ncbi:MAG: TolC family protein [Muribaculum sp.]|nr:TolC family protein [Muribaculum sp.]